MTLTPPAITGRSARRAESVTSTSSSIRATGFRYPDLAAPPVRKLAVECGEPERVTVTNKELRGRTATASGADLAAPTSEPTELTCVPDGSLLVEAHPVWAQDVVVGGALRIEAGADAIVEGSITREESGFPSELRWWRARCRPS